MSTKVLLISIFITVYKMYCSRGPYVICGMETLKTWIIFRWKCFQYLFTTFVFDGK